MKTKLEEKLNETSLNIEQLANNEKVIYFYTFTDILKLT